MDTYPACNAMLTPHPLRDLAPAGIPTFRGVGGMWRKYEATSLATPEAFQRNPSTVWEFYHMRREK
jgi:NAD+-dependent protein deacetylase sirtuin 5